MKQVITPISNRVLILPDIESEVKSKILSGYSTDDDGRIIREKPKPHTGIVVGVSKNVTQIKVGDKLIFPSAGATVLDQNDQDVLMYRACDIFGILEGDKVIPLAL